MAHSCDVCKKNADFMCNTCQHSVYCSEKCQSIDFYQHEKICAPYDVKASFKEKFSKFKETQQYKAAERKGRTALRRDLTAWYNAEKRKLLEAQKEEMRQLRLKQKDERQELESLLMDKAEFALSNTTK